MKKLFVTSILIIIYLPLLLMIISGLSVRSIDVALDGYTNTTQKPILTFSTFLDGSFQTNMTNWFDENIKPRGVLIRTYSTIRYNWFHLANSPVGYNNDLFQNNDIEAELCLGEFPDYNDEKNFKAMEEYVRKLEVVNRKLQQKGKALYVYVTPNKANFNYDNVPKKYKDIADKDSYNAVECFSDLMKGVDVPYLICRDMKDELVYPAFYKTGVHWSRTYEQQVSARLIEDLKSITGKKYRSIVLEDVEESNVPYWRDADVFNLINVWNKNTSNQYYQYKQEREKIENYDTIRVFVQGTSFAQGFIRDITSIYPYENVYYMNRNQYLQNCLTGNIDNFESWKTFDFSNYLNSVDVIVLETTEPGLTFYSWGFIDYLINFLDSYNPSEVNCNYAEQLDCMSSAELNPESFFGFYPKENGFLWMTDSAKCILQSRQLTDGNIEVSFSVPEQLFLQDAEPALVEIYVNGRKAYEHMFKQQWDGTVILDTKDISLNGDVCTIEIYSSKVFNPKKMGMSEDDRNLALRIKYIGGEK